MASTFRDELYKNELLVNVATLYYLGNYSQSAIAEKLGLSRPYISKLLGEAQNAGIVNITIHDPFQSESRLEHYIRTHYELRRVIAVPVSDLDNIRRKVGVAASSYLSTIVSNGDIIATGWGTTMYGLVESLDKRDDLERISVVQLTGMLTGSKQNVYEIDTPRELAYKLGGIPYVLPVPAIFSNQKLREEIFADPMVAKVASLGQRANIALFTVGAFNPGVVKSRSENITEDTVDSLKKHGAVGDVLMHYIDINGNPCLPELENRTASLPLSLLKQKDYRILVACGRNKIESIYAALNGGHANVLITDEDTATGLYEKLVSAIPT